MPPELPVNDSVAVSPDADTNWAGLLGQRLTSNGETTGAGGVGLIVSTAVAIQPVLAAVYVIMTFPDARALYIPDDDPMDTTLALLLLHEPAPVASLSVALSPMQPLMVPVIAAGDGLTVTKAETEFTVVAVGIQPTLLR